MAEPKTIIIDFETFYDTKGKYTLAGTHALTYPEFIKDKRFKVFGMAVDDGQGQEWVPAHLVKEALHEYRNDIIVVHNAFFDGAVLRWHYKYRPAFIIDTIQLANHVLGSARDAGGYSNALDALATRLGLEAKGSNKNMDGVRDPDEAQLAALAIYAKQDAKLERQVLQKLLPFIGNIDFELWLLDHSIRIYTEKALHIDTAKLKIVVEKVKERRKQAIIEGGVPPEVLNSNKQFAEELGRRMVAHKLKVPMKKPLKPRKDGVLLTPALAKGDLAFQKLADSPIEEISKLVNARIVERSAVTVAARLTTMAMYAKMGIGIPVHLVYYGAHTGRFSGGGGFNFQNLTSPSRGATAFDREVARLVREVITAGEGNVFVPTDAAQIEARVLAWLAGEQSILDAYASGADLYSEFISEVLKKDVHKPGEADKKDMAHYVWLGIMRQVGKESVLGLGYSMGEVKFYQNVKAGGSVKSKDLIKFVAEGGFGKEIKVKGGVTTVMAQEIVAFYRNKYQMIVQLWDDINSAFMDAIKGSIRMVGPLKFEKIADRAVGITLPSGRVLYYRNLRKEPEKTQTGQTRFVWKHGAGQRIYGGLLTENVVQAISRDILAESIRNAEDAGYPVVLHIHDEIVPRVPVAQGAEALAFMIKSLSTPPLWGKGMVLGAEGGITETLAK